MEMGSTIIIIFIYVASILYILATIIENIVSF